MKLSGIFVAIICAGISFVGAQRTEITVGYDFQLEVTDSSLLGTTQEVLDLADVELLSVLQNEFPEQSAESGRAIVEFRSIDSEIYSACFTENDECSLVRSNIQISYEGAKPERSVEFVTLEKVQDYFNETTDGLRQVIFTYGYPFVVSSLAEFKMSSVKDKMSEVEVQILEETFLQVFGAIVFAIEGDTEVLEAQFLYQDILDGPDGNADVDNKVLATDLLITGYCRECTSDDFESIVVTVIEENLPAFRNELRVNTNAMGGTFFDLVEEIQFQVPSEPEPLPPISDKSIFDEEAPLVTNKQPWFLWTGIGLAVCILGCGVCLIAKDQGDFADEKDDDFSTSESDPEESHAGSDNLEEPSFEEDPDDDFQVQAVETTDEGADGNYEVFVYE